jgi:hypothetical protein
VRGVTAPAVELTHAADCTGNCGTPWAGTGTPSCQPYPCRCAETRADAPAWSDGKCWWIKRNTGQPRSKCPCWNGSRDGKPGDCCAHHSANVLYADPAAVLVEPDAPPPDMFDIPDGPADWHAPHDREPLWLDDDEEPWGPDPAKERKPFVRRWQPAELTCDCGTPWDVPPGGKPPKSIGFHCAGEGCHTNWTGYPASTIHRRQWTGPCRPPESIVDCDTGDPLVHARLIGGYLVWG